MHRSPFLLAVFSSCLICACGLIWTEAPPVGDDSETPVEGLSPEELQTFAAGDEAFERQFSAADGLGPVFNQVSCAACHVGDGAGHRDNALVRYSRGDDLLLGLGGPQLQSRAIAGVRPERLPPNVQTSTRVAPVLHGMGLIEAIAVSDLLSHADPADEDGDGISGRPNCLPLPSYADVDSPIVQDWLQHSASHCLGGTVMGRFGWKANNATLEQQVAGAYQQDMGITSDVEPEEPNRSAFEGAVPGDLVADPELTSAELQLTTAYVRMLAPPAAGSPSAESTRGEELFDSLACTGCHVPEFTTSKSPVPALRSARARLYSDLLLHDMGPELADNRGDLQASGSEWRTPPLWGLRIKGDFTSGQPFYLHDGRTSDLHVAIELHGGEAESSRVQYQALSESDRDALLDFLRTL